MDTPLYIIEKLVENEQCIRQAAQKIKVFLDNADNAGIQINYKKWGKR